MKTLQHVSRSLNRPLGSLQFGAFMNGVDRNFLTHLLVNIRTHSFRIYLPRGISGGIWNC